MKVPDNITLIYMLQFGYTSLVVNNTNAKQLGVPPFYYRWRNCDTNLTGGSSADQYQRLKLIQQTVRIPGSLYTANLGPLSAYVPPRSDPDRDLYGVCWNQMSDRPVPSVQRASIPTGSNTTMNRRHTSVTSSRPGCQTPGGVGCDIKHNSYDRYLNRIKGKAPMRRGVIPPKFGAPVPFNPAFPVYGGKTTKTNIVNGCGPLCSTIREGSWVGTSGQPYPSATYSFSVGSVVYAKPTGENYYAKAIVIEVNGPEYTIQFVKDGFASEPLVNSGVIQTTNDVNTLLLYFPCNNCPNVTEISFGSGDGLGGTCVFNV